MGKIVVTQTPLEGLLVVEPTVFGDHRGYNMEVYHEEAFAQAGLQTSFVQDNESFSRKGVLRGLHYQGGQPQGKLVRAATGEIYDVAVDLRPNSPTFRQWYGLALSGENKKQLYVPVGFAHGFLVLSQEALKRGLRHNNLAHATYSPYIFL
jgi:dTDP-4-dehydrorhamnose 3,5-epimerase